VAVVLSEFATDLDDLLIDDSLSWWYLEDILTSLQRRSVTGRQRCIGCRTDRVSRNYFIMPFLHIFSRSDVRRPSSDISFETSDLTKIVKKTGIERVYGTHVPRVQ